MPQTASNPLRFHIGAKTLPEGKQNYCSETADPAPKSSVMYSCNGSLDTPANEQRYRHAPCRPRFRWKWRKKSKKPLPSLPSLPYVEENWEEEIKMVEECGLNPYGPEDVASSALQELKLTPTPCSPQIRADYLPSTHHPAPIRWVRHINHVVEEQFANAED